MSVKLACSAVLARPTAATASARDVSSLALDGVPAREVEALDDDDGASRERHAAESGATRSPILRRARRRAVMRVTRRAAKASGLLDARHYCEVARRGASLDVS